MKVKINEKQHFQLNKIKIYFNLDNDFSCIFKIN